MSCITSAMATLNSSSRKQLVLQLLKKRNRAQNPISKGFTLIELLVVIVILGVLGAVGYQAYINQIARANESVASTAATAAAKACAANLVVPDGTFSISDFVDGTQVQITTGATETCDDADDLPITFDVTAGVGGANEAVCSAVVLSGGAVRPGGCT